MKILKCLLILSLTTSMFCSCSDEWDSHYSKSNNEVNNSSVEIVETTALEYLRSNSSFSEMYKLLETSGVVEAINSREQLFTILVAGNEAISNNTSIPVDDIVYLAESHVSDIALSPANINDQLRILMWNDKNLTIALSEDSDGETNISFNNANVLKIVKVNDGYIYELDSYVNSPKSMYEIIESLDESYSIFREMIMSRNEKSFDKNASLPIGIDNTGSTVYDSVFIITNPYFEEVGFNIMSETLTATMLIPSNEVINNALTAANESLEKWGYERDSEILNDWIFQSAFFKNKLMKKDFENNIDFTSVFSKQWRTTIQKVDLDNPVEMSNGLAYYVSEMKIPTNVLIYRIKDYMKWHEFLTAEDKDKYFVLDNLILSGYKTEVAAWTAAAGFAAIENRTVRFVQADETGEYNLDFTPFKYMDNGDGTYEAIPYKIPPGEYLLCAGFKQNMGHNVIVSFEGKEEFTITTSALTKTTYHYDRGAGGYPEGYSTSLSTNSSADKFDRDGGTVATVTIEGEEAKEVKITFHGTEVLSGGIAHLHHWCLKPTANCY